MALIVVRVATVEMQVRTLRGHRNSSLIGGERPRRVVYIVRPGVRSGDLEAVGEALVQAGLQPVVVRGAFELVEGYAETLGLVELDAGASCGEL